MALFDRRRGLMAGYEQGGAGGLFMDPVTQDRLMRARMGMSAGSVGPGGMMEFNPAMGSMERLTGMPSAVSQVMDNTRQADALREQGAPLQDQIMAQADNPFVMALGTEPIAKAGRAVGAAVKPADIQRTKIPQDDAFYYHATNAENAADIADSGSLNPHEPSFGTDQVAWPDGSEAPRVYLSKTGETVKAFAPEEGQSVVLRVPRSEGKFSVERGTGDVVTEGNIPAAALEYLGEDGSWHALAQPLPLDEASRMARAEEMGFTTDSYHYSRNGDDIKAFNEGNNRSGVFDGLGVHSGSKEAAAQRSEGARTHDPVTGKLTPASGPTYPLKIAGGRELLGKNGAPMHEIELTGFLSDLADKLGVNQFTDEGVAAVRKAVWDEYDIIPYMNAVESPGEVSYISPPKNIRSKFAKFDPSKKGSADLLAGVAGAGVLGGGLAASLLAPDTAAAGELEDARSDAEKRYPFLRQFRDVQIVDAPSGSDNKGGMGEYFGASETDGPYGGKPTISIGSKSRGLQGGAADSIIADMVHVASDRSPEFQALKKELRANLSEAELALAKRRYENDYKGKYSGSNFDTFENFVNGFWLDGTVQHLLLPENSEIEGFRQANPKAAPTLDAIESLFRGGSKPPSLLGPGQQ